MGKFIMAFDQGTTSSRCILFNKKGEIISSAQKEFRQIYPKAGWVEHDANEIWISQFSVASEALSKAGASASDISAIGITNQRETVVVWDKRTGIPICNAIVWQCRRTADYCEELKARGFDKIIKKKTGLVLDAYFSATKLKWILDNVPGARKEAAKGNLLFGTIDTWLIWNLTNGKVHATDYSNASRTMLYNIRELRWDEDILKEFDIPACMLPEVSPSSIKFGYTADNLFGGEILIGGVAGDQQAALFGQACFDKGCVKNTYGTGCFLLMNTGENAIESKSGLLTTIAWGIGDTVEYALEGSVFIAGAAIQWLRDEMKLINSASETEEYAQKVENTNGVFFVPAFVGLGAPYWDPYARGTVVGLTRGAKKEHFIRAALESIAYQTSDVLKAMEEDAQVQLKELKVDGGAAANNFLMQFQSDILSVKVERPNVIETTALGAAYLAGLASGYWKCIEEIKENQKIERVFQPQMSEPRREELLKNWKRAVDKSMQWSND